MNLAIIIPRFNPCGYERPRQNFQKFVQSLRDQVDIRDVFVIEALWAGQSSEHGWWTRQPLAATEHNFLWQKESLINFVLNRLPPEYDAVAWIDADLIFRDDWWHDEACDQLGKTPVVQLFEWIETDFDSPIESWGPRVYSTASGPDRLSFNAPGGAIACRRELLTNGIYDRHPLGGGDEIFMDACLGRRPRWFKEIAPAFRNHIQAWQESFGKHEVGFLRGSVKHLWHGDRKGRQYVSRHALLGQHGFDPQVDVQIGENGLLEWANDKPDLHAAVRDYFLNRRDDG